MEDQGLLWSLLFDQISDGVCISMTDGPILYMNPAARRMLGTPEKLDGHRLCDLLCAPLRSPGKDNCAKSCPLRTAQSTEQAMTHTGEFRNPSSAAKTGLRIRCLKMPSVLTNADGREAHLTLIEDISAEVELAREKQDWRHMLAHDLRSPMTTVFGTLRWLEELPKGDPVGSPERRQIQASIAGCQRMMELIDLYLDLSKLEAGAMPIRSATLDLARIARDAVKLARPFADSKKIRLRLSAEKEHEATADPELTRRVIDNILNNALKFTPAGGSVTVKVGAGKSGEKEFSIRDTGPGISREDLPHIFDRFYQASKRQEGVVRSTGLGLAFCKRAVEAMDGRIQVMSVPGSGTEFIVRLARTRR